MINLQGKVALVTGGSRGIGRSISLLFAEAGCNLAINYRTDHQSATDVRQSARESGVEVIGLQADITERSQVEAMLNSVVREFGRIDIVVNNAGVWKSNPVNAMSGKNLRETIDINLLGGFYVIMAAVPHMIKQKSGLIINISSTAGQRGEPFHSDYAASKGGIISLTKSLAVELAPHNIRVNCVAPGWVDTGMTHAALAGENGRKIKEQIPLGHVASPDELAGPVLFLASDLASFITGEVLNVNGGAVLCG